eukprot:gene12540-26416_t
MSRFFFDDEQMIDEEDSKLNPVSKKGKGKKQNRPSQSIPSTENSTTNQSIEQQQQSATTSASEQNDSSPAPPQIMDEESYSPVSPSSSDSKMSNIPAIDENGEMADYLFSNPLGMYENGKQMKVPRDDPLKQSKIPPEVVFFGDPRRPPPIEAGGDTRYHGALLFWARHATVAPRTSEERLATVFPKGRLHPEAPKYRLQASTLTYQNILNSFMEVQNDLQASNAFISANIDIIPPKMFLRALTAQKLSYQSKNNLDKMSEIKEIRQKYLTSHDQVFFPLNIEVLKAET